MEAVSKEEALGTLLADVISLLEDLFQSGFDTVHDSTLGELGKMTEAAKQYGMEYLSELLSQLTAGLESRRHQTVRKEDGLAGVYAVLNEYLYLCTEKTAYDKGLAYYKKKEEENDEESKGHT